MLMFYDWLGPKKSERIRLAVMDMWKPFRNAAAERAPKTDFIRQVHIMRYLGEALDEVRKSEYARLSAVNVATSKARSTPSYPMRSLSS
jgi:transposase